MKKAVIFDLDGTLLHTIEDIHHALNIALQSHGFDPIDIAVTTASIGSGAFNLVKNVLQIEDLTQTQTVYETYQNYYNEHLTIYTKPYEGIIEMLQWLQDKHISVGIVSNKHHDLVDILVQRYFPHIQFKVGMKPFIKIKPHPDMILHIMKEMNIKPIDAVFVGDSEADILASKHAQVDVIAVSYGYRDKDVLLKLNPNQLVDSVIELKRYLKEII